MRFLKNFMMIQNKIKLITHDGSFHTDDIFAAATLSILLEKKNKIFEIIRTRDEEIIKNGDYVFDVGSVYNADKNRFDHHQIGGAGSRSFDGVEIEYASFGLVWKKFGIELCGDQKIVDLIEKKLVAPIDAGDNGFNLVELKNTVAPYFIQNAFNSFYPGWKEVSSETMFSGFLECVKIAQKILNNEIIQARDIVEAEEIIFTTYKNTKDKRIIVLDKKYPWYEQIKSYPEPLFVIYNRESDGFWAVHTIRENNKDFKTRKDLPKSWAGLRDKELQKISDVSDAVFCHRTLFMAVAKSKEGAVKLAEIALES